MQGGQARAQDVGVRWWMMMRVCRSAEVRARMLSACVWAEPAWVLVGRLQKKKPVKAR